MEIENKKSKKQTRYYELVDLRVFECLVDNVLHIDEKGRTYNFKKGQFFVVSDDEWADYYAYKKESFKEHKITQIKEDK